MSMHKRIEVRLAGTGAARDGTEPLTFGKAVQPRVQAAHGAHQRRLGTAVAVDPQHLPGGHPAQYRTPPPGADGPAPNRLLLFFFFWPSLDVARGFD